MVLGWRGVEQNWVASAGRRKLFSTTLEMSDQWEIHFQVNLKVEVTLPKAFRLGIDGPLKELAWNTVPGWRERE